MNFGWISQAPWIALLAAWVVLIIEIAYGLCLLFPQARLWWLLLTSLLHLCIGITANLWFFSLTMIALNIAAQAGSPRLGRLRILSKIATWSSVGVTPD